MIPRWLAYAEREVRCTLVELRGGHEVPHPHYRVRVMGALPFRGDGRRMTLQDVADMLDDLVRLVDATEPQLTDALEDYLTAGRARLIFYPSVFRRRWVEGGQRREAWLRGEGGSDTVRIANIRGDPAAAFALVAHETRHRALAYREGDPDGAHETWTVRWEREVEQGLARLWLGARAPSVR